MASAVVETFCCSSSRNNPSILVSLSFDIVSYNVVCISSAVLGIFGALYQILPSSPIQHYRIPSGNKQKQIIIWLAVADLFASSGILVRSVIWICWGDLVTPSDKPDGQRDYKMILCALTAIWIRYFYTATFIWTLCYAIDVYLVSKRKTGKLHIYHIVVWNISAVLTAVGLGTLYYPDFRCHSDNMWRVLPNYLLSYIPIIIIMFANPILYCLASKQVRILLTGGLGQFTCREHSLMAALKEKFFFIVFVFIVCWLPNVLNGIILWSCWDEFQRSPSKISKSTIIGLWYMMAVLNPLQALLNSLVYKGWENCSMFCKYVCCRWRHAVHQGLLAEISSTEISSSSENERTHFSTNADE